MENLNKKLLDSQIAIADKEKEIKAKKVEIQKLEIELKRLKLKHKEIQLEIDEQKIGQPQNTYKNNSLNRLFKNQDMDYLYSQSVQSNAEVANYYTRKKKEMGD